MKTLKLTLLFLALICFSACRTGLQKESKQPVSISWQLLTDKTPDGEQLARLVIYNQSGEDLNLRDQDLWFSSMKRIAVESVQAPFELNRINGDLYRLSYTSPNSLASHDSLVLQYAYSSLIVNFTDAPAGLYVKSDSGDASAWNVKDYRLLPYANAVKEQLPFLEQQYDLNEELSRADKDIRIIPQPVKMTVQEGSFSFSKKTAVHFDTNFKQEEEAFKTEWKKIFAFDLNAVADKPDNVILVSYKSGMSPESYKLHASKDTLLIEASDGAGAFYGLQTLKELLPKEVWIGNQDAVSIPAVYIEDEPRFGYRGLSFDIARNFHSKEETENLLDLMAAYKMNVLHFHFTDDEGWRLEIPALPELTAVGSKRDADFEKGLSLQPSYGSGAKTADRQFLSKTDFVEILRYARDRHIRVIPEIETPGHARAAIKAMDARYEAFMKQGREKDAKEYLLRDPEDKSVYRSAQDWNDNVINVALPSAYHFLRTVVGALKDMYQEAGLTMDRIHFGTDEVPGGVWERSPAVAQLMDSLHLSSVYQVWPYYIGKIKELSASEGLKMMGWEEMGMVNNGKGMQPNPEFGNQDIQLNVWNNVVGGGHEDLAYRLANQGYKVVYTSANNFYLDLAWDKTYQEPGHNWAGYISLKKAFGFIPFDFYKNQIYDIRGRKLRAGYFDQKERLTAEGQKNIVGIEAGLWSEKISRDERLEYMLFPRLMAVAEKGWSAEKEWEKPANAEWESAFEKDWISFLNRVNTEEFEKLDFLNGGYHYRVPDIGVRIKADQVVCNTISPMWEIHYTTDGTEPTEKSARYAEPLSVQAGLRLKAFSKNGRSGKTYEIQ